MHALVFEHLEVCNFKSFVGEHHFRLNRKPGVYYVSGRNQVEPDLGANGVGKSSLWDALYWCLTGKTIRSSRPGSSTESWGTDGQSYVRLALRKDGERYWVYRSRRPNSLQVEDKEDEESGREVEQAEVDKLLGMSDEVLRRTIIIGQFGTMFLDMKPEKQAEMFSDALGLDLWISAAEAAKAAARLASTLAADARSLVARLNGQLDETKANLNREKKEAEREEEKAGDRISEYERMIAKVQGEMDLLKAPQAKTVFRLREKRKNLQARVRTLQVERATLLKEKQKLHERIEEYGSTEVCPECGQRVSRGHLSEKRQKLLGERAIVEEKLTGCTTDLTTAEQKLVTVERELDQGDQEYNSKLRLRTRREELERILDSLRKEENSHTRNVKSLATRLADLKGKLAKAEQNLEEQETTAAKAQNWAEAFREIRLEIIDEFISELELTINSTAEELGLKDWSIKLSTERETSSGQVTNKFTVFIYPPGMDEPIQWECYSGGEAQRWQLAATFALSEILLDHVGLTTNLEVLDEPTRHLSRSGIDDLLDYLERRAVELGRAIYFVDHRSLDRGAFEDVIMIEKTKEGSLVR